MKKNKVQSKNKSKKQQPNNVHDRMRTANNSNDVGFANEDEDRSFKVDENSEHSFELR